MFSVKQLQILVANNGDTELPQCDKSVSMSRSEVCFRVDDWTLSHLTQAEPVKKRKEKKVQLHKAYSDLFYSHIREKLFPKENPLHCDWEWMNYFLFNRYELRSVYRQTGFKYLSFSICDSVYVTRKSVFFLFIKCGWHFIRFSD